MLDEKMSFNEKRGLLMKSKFGILTVVLFVFMVGVLLPNPVSAAAPSSQNGSMEEWAIGAAFEGMQIVCGSPADEKTRKECREYYDQLCREYDVPSQYKHLCGNSFLQIWRQYKVTILIGLAGIAILIGMILYDRSQKRNAAGSYGGQRFGDSPRQGSRFSFDDDQDEDIFWSERSDRGGGDPRRSYDMDDEDFRNDAPRRADDLNQRGEVNRWGDSSEIALPKRGGGGSLRLRGIEGDFAGQAIPLSNETITIGRSRDCNLVMRDYVKGVSKMHCAVRFSSSRKCYQVMDLGSSYGTYLNGVKLGAKSPRDLKKGDTIYLGSKKVGFRVTD